MKRPLQQTNIELALIGARKLKSIKNRLTLSESELIFLIELSKKYKRKLPNSLAELLHDQ